jgi:hypothetical protein
MKKMEKDEGGYIVYKRKLPRDYWEDRGKYMSFHLVTDYGLRIDSDWNGNLKNIYLYDKENGVEYIVRNINNLENIVIDKFPKNITINYYEFCSGGSGVKNSHEIVKKINSILGNNKIKFIFENYDPWNENNDYSLYKIIMDTCLGG